MRLSMIWTIILRDQHDSLDYIKKRNLITVVLVTPNKSYSNLSVPWQCLQFSWYSSNCSWHTSSWSFVALVIFSGKNLAISSSENVSNFPPYSPSQPKQLNSHNPVPSVSRLLMRNVVQLCLAKCLAEVFGCKNILLMRKRNHAFLPIAIDLT